MVLIEHTKGAEDTQCSAASDAASRGADSGGDGGVADVVVAEDAEDEVAEEEDADVLVAKDAEDQVAEEEETAAEEEASAAEPEAALGVVDPKSADKKDDAVEEAELTTCWCLS